MNRRQFLKSVAVGAAAVAVAPALSKPVQAAALPTNTIVEGATFGYDGKLCRIVTYRYEFDARGKLISLKIVSDKRLPV